MTIYELYVAVYVGVRAAERKRKECLENEEALFVSSRVVQVFSLQFVLYGCPYD